MISTASFDVVDVFATGPLSGNQLAVVRLEDHSRLEHRTEASDLQAIAAEFGFSETVFVPDVVNPAEPVPVRIFTPGLDLPFAGRPTLGAAWVIRRMLGNAAVEALTLLEQIGAINTWFDAPDPHAPVWMRQAEPVFGGTLDRPRVASALGIHESDITPDLPVRIVSTGVPYAIVPLESIDAVVRARENAATSAEPFRASGADPTAWFVFASGHTDPESAREGLGAYHVRMFASPFGIVEDPATGSANGCFAAYLAEYVSPAVEAIVEQGYEIGRPSRLMIRARRDGQAYRVEVGGVVRPFARGRIDY